MQSMKRCFCETTLYVYWFTSVLIAWFMKSVGVKHLCVCVCVCVLTHTSTYRRLAVGVYATCNFVMPTIFLTSWFGAKLCPWGTVTLVRNNGQPTNGIRRRTNMEHYTKTKVLVEILCQWHFVNSKPHVDWPDSESVSPCYEPGD